MSVQAGIWNLDGSPIDREALSRISQTSARYGPDDETISLHNNIAMFYRAFHTNAESRLEKQPSVSDAGEVITWDGRLDNRDDLISQVGSFLRTDKTDTSIVLAALERWGTNAFAKLVGDWALALWSVTQQRLILARDYIGTRQLYYSVRRNRVTWCSHLAPLVLCGDQFTLSEEYILGFLAAWPEADLTPYAQIKSVPPACFLEIDGSGVRVRRYWTFNPRARITYRKDEEYEDHFRTLFREAVRRRVRADSPIVCELSGGFDSSAIVCMVDELVKDGGVAGSLRVQTFSTWDPDEPQENDFAYFTAVERKRGKVGHHAKLVSMGDSIAIDRTEFVAAPGFGSRQEFRAAECELLEREGARVILSGFGGDEFVGNALDLRVQLADLFVGLQWGLLVKNLMAWSLVARIPLIYLIRESAALLLPIWTRRRESKRVSSEPWLSEEFARRLGFSRNLATAGQGALLWKPSSRDAHATWLGVSRKLNGPPTTTAETRYPFLDQSLTEFLMAVPTTQLLRPGDRRSLMKRSLRQLLPAEVLARKNKASSGRHIAVTLEKHWTRLEGMLADPLSCRLGYLNRDGLCSALRRVRQGQVAANLLRVLRALSLEIWLQDCVRRGVIAGS